MADITIADFWGIEKTDPAFDSPNGVSLVLLNNDKGKRFYASLGDKVVSKAATLESAIRGNVNLVAHRYTRLSTVRLFTKHWISKAFDTQWTRMAIQKCLFVQRLRRFVKRMILRR